MLDGELTRVRFNDWINSSDFKTRYRLLFRTPKWPFIGVVISLSCFYLFPDSFLFGPSILASGLFLLWGFKFWNTGRINRKRFRQLRKQHEPIVCTVVIANRGLLEIKGALAPAVLVGSFGPQDEETLERVSAVALVFAGLYGEDPNTVPPELQAECRTVNDDAYRPHRRQKPPASYANCENLWLFDTLLMADDLPANFQEDGQIVCMATPGRTGMILHLPPSLVVFKEVPYNPNIINYSARSTPPPLVAPMSETLDSVVEHITRYLGYPGTVYHELISTTVHIDVHIVEASPERPWVSLVTSGMSDVPMNTPESSSEFRFAELMIRLPADWKLDNESLKQEENYWPIRTLKFLARFAHEYETWLSFGHTIPNGNPPAPLSPGHPFVGVVLSPPWIGGEEFATLRLASGTPVHFWSLIPLYPYEMDFKLTNGAIPLFEKFEASGFSDLFNPNRPPVV
jgi:hypothetical protein